MHLTLGVVHNFPKDVDVRDFCHLYIYIYIYKKYLTFLFKKSGGQPLEFGSLVSKLGGGTPSLCMMNTNELLKHEITGKTYKEKHQFCMFTYKVNSMKEINKSQEALNKCPILALT